MMGSSSWSWNQLCGPNNSIHVWQNGDIGTCFQQLVFVCISHILWAVISGFYCGKWTLSNFNPAILPNKRKNICNIRCGIALLFFLTAILEILLPLWIEKSKPSLSDILTGVTVSLSWLLHALSLYKLKQFLITSSRGTGVLIFVYVLILISFGFQVHTVILQIISQTQSKVKEAIICTQAVFHVFYIATLLPSSTSVEKSLRALDIQERERLISQHATVYGSISNDTEGLGVAEEGSNIFSKLSFWWVQPLMVKGAKEELTQSRDLFTLPRKLRTSKIEDKFSIILQGKEKEDHYSAIPDDGGLTDSYNVSYNELPEFSFRGSRYRSDSSSVPNSPQNTSRQRETDKHKNIGLLKALHKAFGTEYYLLGLLKLFTDGLGFLGPILLNYLVSFMENKNEPMYHGYVFAAGLFLSTLLQGILSSQFNYLISVVGLKIRAAVITTIYRKSLATNCVSLSRFSTGEVVNFMSTDTDRIVNFCPSFHAFWSLPFQIAVSLYLLHQQVGLAFLAGLGFAIILIPINRWLAVKIGQLSTEMMAQKDSRVKVMTEILFGIRVIKFYAWEDHFSKKINKLRNAELKSLKGRKYLDALCVYFWATTPVLISILTFTTYSLLGNHLTAAKVFTSLALFNMLIGPLNAFPWVINGLMEAWVSVKRVQEFMKLQEIDWKKYYSTITSRTAVLEVDNADFSWTTPDIHDNQTQQIVTNDNIADDTSSNAKPSKTLRLQNISLKIEEGHLIGVIGKVGSGKSSLLSAFLAEMAKANGRISLLDVKEGFGLVSQESWIQHATVRENILFGQTFDVKKYQRVIQACALEEDFKILPAGDQTEVGENGVTLSGGQKARVALARAVYQDKSVYLLDDPLAAVDAHVANHLFFLCIMGYLKDKTCVLCTHHTKFLKHADVIVVMDEGEIKTMGPPSEILSQIDLDASFKNTGKEDGNGDGNSDDEGSEQEDDRDFSLVQEEEKDKGVVKLHIYKSYWKAVGNCLAPMVLLSLLLMQASRNINDWWLSYWVSHAHHNDSILNATGSNLLKPVPTGSHHFLLVSTSAYQISQNYTPLVNAEDNVQYYLTVYGILAGCNSLFTLCRAFLFAYGGICAAQVIHKKLLSSILKAPISFFDVTPIGRIINRFSSDLYSIDDSLPFIMNILLAQFYGLLGTLAITCYGLPWFTLLLLPLGAVYYYIQGYYRQTSREIKRITSVTLSPIYAHFSESVTGLVTIRALRAVDRFKKENEEKLEENQRAQFAGNAVAQWLNIRLQMIGVAMVTGVAFIAVLEHHFQTVDPGLVGLAISYALSVTNLLSGVVSSFTETEKQMVSVERAGQYTEGVPREKQGRGTLEAPDYWPIQGTVSFHQVSLRYRPGLPFALNNVTFDTQPAEKIGIVGRTGSGKSSLFLALFRMVEIENGHITIDGIGISHVGLKELRSRLAVIPQDPFLFSGTVRENLDPTHSYADSALWGVLDRCHLVQVVQRLGGLDAEVSERGRHFSVGQRQLMCLARALLTRAKVLCIDEATASVDMETDMLIQQTIREEFKDNTVLTIAHRINTVMDSDRVLVMDSGQVAEFQSPAALLANKNSLFSSLVGDTGSRSESEV